MDQRAWVLGSQSGPTSQKKKKTGAWWSPLGCSKKSKVHHIWLWTVFELYAFRMYNILFIFCFWTSYLQNVQYFTIFHVHLFEQNNFLNDGVPPTPPTRYSSIRNSNTSNYDNFLIFISCFILMKINHIFHQCCVLFSGSFETRFLSLFHGVDEFPPPQPYKSCLKIYNSSIKGKVSFFVLTFFM